MKNETVVLYAVVLYYSTYQHNYDVRQHWFMDKDVADRFQASYDYIKSESYSREFDSYREALKFFLGW